MPVFNFLIGLSTLLLGRQLFWLFVGAVGFLLGVQLAARFAGNQPIWVLIVIALAVGALGAMFAIVFQHVAIGIAGFAAGVLILIHMLRTLDLSPGPFGWVFFLLAGVAGAVLVLALFDWALIILSSLTGATLLVQIPELARPPTLLLFLILVFIGIVVQASLLQRRRPPPPRRRRG